MISYELLNATSKPVDEKVIQAGLKKAEKKLGDIGERHIVIEIVTPEESAKLNQQLREKKEPTDIISVSTMETRVGEQVITEDKGGGLHFTLDKNKYISHEWPVLGQLILCQDVIEANAKRAGQLSSRELEWVVEHGVYHVMGFHHDNDK